MRRASRPWHFLCALLALVVLTGLIFAGEATVVSYNKDTMKLVVLEKDKERALELKKGTHVHDVDGKEVNFKNRADKLTKGARIDIEEEDGKLIEINILKKK